jgi:mannose-1-phosphate guanylyltransferase
MAKTPGPMKAVIFAGGIGSRMWPLSRKKSPKQFEPIMEGKSTLQLTVERLRPSFAWDDIFISTGVQYVSLISKQLPEIPLKNIIGEPEMRDVAPAVGYLMSIIAKDNPNTPTAILWSDHLVDRVDVFIDALRCGAMLLEKEPHRLVFIGQKPRFANQNLGWIEYGDVIEHVNGFDVRSFISWHYRPTIEQAKKYYSSKRYAWNPGYFVVTPSFVLDQYKRHAPDMYQKLQKIAATIGKPGHQKVLDEIYPTMEKISFDDAVVTKTPPDKAVVLSVDLGWSDVGTWEALKEALQLHPSDNLTLGNAQLLNTSNSVVYSYTDQMIAAIDVDDMVVVVTKDAVLVTRQQSVPQIKDLLKRFEGTDLERLT